MRFQNYNLPIISWNTCLSFGEEGILGIFEPCCFGTWVWVLTFSAYGLDETGDSFFMADLFLKSEASYHIEGNHGIITFF